MKAKKTKSFISFMIALILIVGLIPSFPGDIDVSAAGYQFRVGSFNIKNADGGWRVNDIANQIRDYNLDIVGVQEVDYYTSRCYQDTLREIANRLGYEYYYCKAIDYQGGQYGIGVLSRHSITSRNRITLTSTREQRVMLHVTIRLGNGATVNFFNTHLEDEDSNCRLTQLTEIANKVSNTTPYILTGDFNCTPARQDNYITNAVWANSASYNRATYETGSCLDNVIASANSFAVCDSGTAVNDISDHYMLWSDLYMSSSMLEGTMPVSVGANCTYKIKNVANSKFLTQTNGNNVSSEAEDKSYSQLWRFERGANNVYKIYNVSSSWLMDGADFKDENGTNIQMWIDNGSQAQRYYVYKINGKFAFKPVYTTNLALDVDQASGNCQLWSFASSNNNQLFTLERMDLLGAQFLDMGKSFTASVINTSTGLAMNANGTKVNCTAANGGDPQKWLFTQKANGGYVVKNLSTGKYINVPSNVSGTDVTLADSGTILFLYPNGDQISIRARYHSDMAFDMDANSKDVHIYPRTDGEVTVAAQKFDIIWTQLDGKSCADIGAKAEVFMRNCYDGLYLTYDDDNNVYATEVTLYNQQKWIMTRQSDGSYTIIQKQKNLSLDVAGGSNATGTNVRLYNPNGTAAQKFFLFDVGDGSYIIRPSHTGKVLDVSPSSKNLQIYNSNYTYAQRFNLYASDTIEGVSTDKTLGTDFEAYINSTMTGMYLSGEATTVTGKAKTLTDEQIWKFTRLSTGEYKIENKKTGKVLAVSNVSTGSGTEIITEAWTDAASQKFYIYYHDSSYYFKLSNKDLFIDMDAETAILHCYSYGVTEIKIAAQRFDIVKKDLRGLNAVNVGQTAEVKIQSMRTSNYLTYNSDNILCTEKNATQTWILTRDTDGSYMIKNKATGNVIDVKAGTASMRNDIQIYNSNDTAAQRFFLYQAEEGVYYIRPSYTSKVIDISSEGNAWLYRYNSTAAQKFVFLKADGTKLGLYDDSEKALMPKKTITYSITASKMIKNITVGTVASEVINQFDNKTLVVRDSKGTVVNASAALATGYKISLEKDGKTIDSLTVIVRGDVDGDANVTTTDYLRIKAVFLEKYSFDDIEFQAADIDNSGVIDSTDYLNIKVWFLNAGKNE